MKNKTASMLIIGNEILSGKTQDKNLNYIAKRLSEIGIEFAETRIVRDITAEIVAALNELRNKYDYVFTTGGIGPTHDDITIDAVATAFGVTAKVNESAAAALKKYYEGRGLPINASRLKMAVFPEGAELIENHLTAAPGCKIGNVFVLAGIPSIMQVMFDHVCGHLQQGKKILSQNINCNLTESMFAERLGEIQKQNPQTEIGSYPYLLNGSYAASLVVRTTDKTALQKTMKEIEIMVSELGGVVLDGKNMKS